MLSRTPQSTELKQRHKMLLPKSCNGSMPNQWSWLQSKLRVYCTSSAPTFNFRTGLLTSISLLQVQVLTSKALGK